MGRSAWSVDWETGSAAYSYWCFLDCDLMVSWICDGEISCEEVPLCSAARVSI